MPFCQKQYTGFDEVIAQETAYSLRSSLECLTHFCESRETEAVFFLFFAHLEPASHSPSLCM
jgi:hypothetical protein